MWQKPSFNPEVPNIARTYDYLLGGKDNYPADREIGDIFIGKFPGAVQIALDNRACLVRAVTRMAAELGISQFIDLGSGLPTADNVHQVARRADPGARVAYVDNDPIVLAHGRAMLAEDEFTAVVNADIRQPEQILSDPGAHGELPVRLALPHPERPGLRRAGGGHARGVRPRRVAHQRAGR
jgi:S-adenosyl methyltransferase